MSSERGGRGGWGAGGAPLEGGQTFIRCTLACTVANPNVIFILTDEMHTDAVLGSVILLDLP